MITSLAACGWCEGTLALAGVVSDGNCIDPSTAPTWYYYRHRCLHIMCFSNVTKPHNLHSTVPSIRSCDGVFKDASECDCAVSGAPGALVNLGILRGLRIDYDTMNEIQIEVPCPIKCSVILHCTFYTHQHQHRMFRLGLCCFCFSMVFPAVLFCIRCFFVRTSSGKIS